jgi:hypothetical protein
MSLLPTMEMPATAVNPKTLVIFGHTKQGKTTAVANLKDNLIIDLEGGTRYYECMKIDVPAEAEKQGVSKWEILKSILGELKAYKAANGKNMYKRITIDTVGVLEDVIMPYAVQLHKTAPQHKNFKGTDLKAVPNGAGWLAIRDAFFNVIATLNLFCDNTILIAHTKGKTITRRGSELTVVDIDVSGKMSQMLAGNADAIALIYRRKNETVLSFKSDELVAAGARIKHLREKEIVLYESDDQGNMTFHWDRIFKEDK